MFSFLVRRGAQQSQPGLWVRALASKAGNQPKIMKATAEAYAEGPTALVRKEAFKFIVDEPPKLGGRGLGPNPLTYLLGSLVACTQYTMTMIVKESKLPGLQRVMWSAAGEYDLRGVQGVEGTTDARFQKITVKGIVDTEASQDDLNAMVDQVEKRCIVAATLNASGMDLQLNLEKGTVEHDCQPACELHELSSGSNTGTTTSNPGREADSPKFSGTGGNGKPTSRGFHTSAFFSEEAADGEDIAREHLHAELEPQLQKETSKQGAPETAGGAYASRDSPRAQAGPPTDGMSDADIVREQTAGADVPHKEGEEEENEESDTSGAPSFAGKANEMKKNGGSPLGLKPSGQE